MKLDRYTVRKQWLIAWNNFLKSWSHFEWFCPVSDNKLITFSITMLLMLSLKDGTNLYYIGTDSKISTVEKMRVSIQARQDIALTSISNDCYVSYYEFRLVKVDQNGVDVDYFVRVNEIEHMGKVYTEHEITRELGQFSC